MFIFQIMKKVQFVSWYVIWQQVLIWD